MRLAHVWYHAYALPDSKLNPKKENMQHPPGGACRHQVLPSWIQGTEDGGYANLLQLALG